MSQDTEIALTPSQSAQILSLLTEIRDSLCPDGGIRFEQLSVTEFCKRTNLDRHLVYKLIWRGTIPATLDSQHYRISATQVRKFRRLKRKMDAQSMGTPTSQAETS